MIDPRMCSLILAISTGLSSAAARRGAEETPAKSPGEKNPARAAKVYLRELAARSKNIRSLRMKFRQEKRLRILRRPRTSEGELWYADGRLSMVVRRQGTVESHLLMAEGELKILYPRLQRLEILAMKPTGKTTGKTTGGGSGRGTRAAIPFLTGDWTAVEKDYKVALRRERAKDRDVVVLNLVPREPTSPVKNIRMVLVDYRLREYSQVEASGDRVRLEVRSWEVNPRLSPERFRLAVPPGTRTFRLGDAPPK